MSLSLRLTSLVVALLLAVPVQAAVPSFFPTQGVIRDSTGTPVYEGVYSVLFSLYDAADAAVPLWTEAWPPTNVDCTSEPQMCVQVTDGVFYAELGSHLPLTPELFSSGTLWMGVSVEGEPELPRTRLGTMAYAFFSGWSDYAVDAGLLGGHAPEAFEPVGAAQEAVAQHEAAHPHLSADAVAALSGGADSDADAFHTHTNIKVAVSAGEPFACDEAALGSLYLESADQLLRFCTTGGWTSGLGPEGPEGPQGPEGPEGPAGSTATVSFADAFVGACNATSSSCKCNAGEFFMIKTTGGSWCNISGQGTADVQCVGSGDADANCACSCFK
ncbi:MAG: hypothetical protein VYE15_08150 [Myxococcota bacterium]|nr:hypothetical protein [Myxococcota bacterium]